MGKVFPNPVNELLHINNLDDFSQLTLYNIQGKPVLQKKIGPMMNDINTENLVPGMYFIYLTGSDKSLTFKILKQ